MATASMVRARNGCSSCSSVSVQPMRITDVEPIVLRIDGLDATRADGTQDAFLVRVHTDEGIVGIGEADTSPYVARTIVEMPSSHSIARGLREVLVGEDPLQTDRLWQLMFEASDHYGRGGAALHTISAIDIALWDIAGKAAGRPVSELLGGRRTSDVRVYASEVMPETPDEVRRIAERAADAGYEALKLGWGPLGHDLAHDAALVAAARETLGPERSLMLDGGRAYTVKRALELLRRVEEHELYWFEEPLRARRPRRLPPPLRCGAACESLRARPTRPSVPSARWSSTGTSTFCNPISRGAAASRWHGRSRCSSARRPSRSCRTASRRVCSSRHRCTSWRRSTAPPGPSTPSPTRRSSTGSCASRSRCATAGCRCRPARASGSSSTRTPVDRLRLA